MWMPNWFSLAKGHVLTIQPQQSPCVFHVPCGRHKNTSISLTSPPVWNGVCPEGLTWEVSIYPPAEPCAVPFETVTGRVLCQAIHNRALSRRWLIVLTQRARGAGQELSAPGAAGCQQAFGRRQLDTKSCCWKGKERWASDHMEGRMSGSGVKQPRDFCFSVLYLRDTHCKLFI